MCTRINILVALTQNWSSTFVCVEPLINMKRSFSSVFFLFQVGLHIWSIFFPFLSISLLFSLFLSFLAFFGTQNDGVYIVFKISVSKLANGFSYQYHPYRRQFRQYPSYISPVMSRYYMVNIIAATSKMIQYYWYIEIGQYLKPWITH